MSTAKPIETGPWAGWKTWPQDTFETGTGPFYMRQDEQGRVICRFVAEPRHMNGGGFMHGGCFLTFADFACFAIADEHTQGPSVTVNLSGDFLAAGQGRRHDGSDRRGHACRRPADLCPRHGHRQRHAGAELHLGDHHA